MLKLLLNSGFADVILTAIGALLGAFYVYVTTHYLCKKILKKEEFLKKEEKFNKILLQGLKNNSVKSIEDIIHLCKGLAGSDLEDVNYRNDLSKLLRRFYVKLVSQELSEEVQEEQILNWKEKITEFIRINDKMFPFSDLPAAERSVLNDMSSFIDNGDKESLRRKIAELAGMIQIKNQELDKAQDTNHWSVPLAASGLILTVFFGIIAIFIK
jgi:CRISPR/Cas system CMR subunit Cmr4 (Cas7 group RAMP superfamily)